MQGHYLFAQLPSALHVSAATEAAKGSSNTLLTFLPFILIIAVFYFLMIRPQQNRRKQMQRMQNELVPGQRVMTTAAMFATVVAVDDDTIVLEIAPGVEARFNRAAIAQVITSPEEAGSSDGSGDASDSTVVEPPAMGEDGLPETAAETENKRS